MKRIPCEVYSRIVGYYRPISNWNNGMQEQHKDRKNFKLPPKAIQGVSDKHSEEEMQSTG